MTLQEIEDIILLSLYTQDKSKNYGLPQILANNNINKPEQELKDIAADLTTRGLIQSKLSPSPVEGRIIPAGIKYVEAKLLPDYNSLQLEIGEVLDILNRWGFKKDAIEIKGRINEGPLTISVNSISSKKKPYFSWIRNQWTFKINSFPTIKSESVLSHQKIRSAFSLWAEAIFNMGSKENDFEETLHALSMNFPDSNLINLGYDCQGITGYVLIKGTPGTVPLVEFTTDLTNKKVFYTIYPDDTNEDLKGNRLKKAEIQKDWYVFTDNLEGTIPLRRFHGPKKSPIVDHFYSTSPHSDALRKEGYKEDNIQGFIFEKDGEGRQPLYVYSTNRSKLFFTPIEEARFLKFYVVTSVQGDKNRAKSMISNGFWENPYVDRYLDVVKGVGVGDILFLKSVAKNGLLKVQAVGVVYGNPRDGKKLLVQWHYKQQFSLDNLSRLNNAIEVLSEEDAILIISAIGKENFESIFFPTPSTTDSPKEPTEQINEVVRLQGDGSTVDDQLLRKPFVNALKSHIERYWKETDNQDSYTIHLDGEWGSGKSSILDMLELNLQEDKWTVVRYNAWQNQHLEKPWWVLLYKLYQATLSSESIEFRRMCLTWYNFKWKVVLPNKAVLLSTVLIAFALYILFNSFGSGWLFSFEPTTESWLKIVGLSITIFGGIWATSNFVVNTILSGSSKPEDSFYKKLSDPMDSLKSYFKNIVSISSKNTAIFIDDLDRCREGTTVGLLEGIQTLFKDQKVLYIIAGDGQWISTCFEVHYSAFKHDKAGHSLGDSFLAKVFQMSTAVPTMSPEAKGQYLRHLLNIDTSSNQGMKNSNEIADEIKQATSETELSNIIQVNKNKANVNQQALRISASEKLSELDLKKDISHVLIEHENDLEPNARSIKRFINNYSLARNSLFLEGKTLADISQPSLIKWLIVSSRWPSYSYALKKNPNELDNIKKTNSAFNKYVKGWLTVELIQKLS
ncbi:MULTISPECIES: P-loop NTPase fold protein [unclassified Imperialibacter]|uniref:KAP family P-loop NTPase fold protein n=1 Tax=unclassified Imperialibacter TaxID=2629706 RepID=UPI001255CDE0|nr:MULTISPECIES: P-loop NTPase fold protein [unclassified Imperialibacter]CAD5267460.1 hypothetical protein IMPERIA89_340049 [Imperialibacter sp. 89]CAD5295874.1 hypothetical protein IMPERIA75_700049 [Imperialibacter sp. 75]VVT33636.1 hypothetical protein IMPR6_690049 [Imperialibacter sp. EC-SDR9]